MSDKFRYTYSAPTEEERREIEDIRRQYTVSAVKDTLEIPQAEKLSRLRSLHSRVYRSSKWVAIILGIFGTLVFGFGLTMVLEWQNYFAGVPVGIVGMAILCIIHPLYKAILRRMKEKHGSEIVALCENLLNIKQD